MKKATIISIPAFLLIVVMVLTMTSFDKKGSMTKAESKEEKKSEAVVVDYRKLYMDFANEAKENYDEMFRPSYEPHALLMVDLNRDAIPELLSLKVNERKYDENGVNREFMWGEEPVKTETGYIAERAFSIIDGKVKENSPWKEKGKAVCLNQYPFYELQMYGQEVLVMLERDENEHDSYTMLWYDGEKFDYFYDLPEDYYYNSIGNAPTFMACLDGSESIPQVMEQLLNEFEICVSEVDYGQNFPKVFLNGTEIDFDVPPVIQNGRTLVPVRAITEAMGMDVHWNDYTQLITISANKVVNLRVYSSDATVNGQKFKLDVPAKIVNDRTLVPLRFIGEAFGAVVSYDETTNRIDISMDASYINDNLVPGMNEENLKRINDFLGCFACCPDSYNEETTDYDLLEFCSWRHFEEGYVDYPEFTDEYVDIILEKYFGRKIKHRSIYDMAKYDFMKYDIIYTDGVYEIYPVNLIYGYGSNVTYMKDNGDGTFTVVFDNYRVHVREGDRDYTRTGGAIVKEKVVDGYSTYELVEMW